MGFEIQSSQEQKKNPLYPERIFKSIEEKIEVLSKFEKGDLTPIELTATEMESLITFEEGLAAEIEPAFKITSSAVAYYTEYFLTAEGKKDFEQVTGVSLVAETEGDLIHELAEKRSLLRKVDDATASKLRARSEQAMELRVIKDFEGTLDTEGNIQNGTIAVPQRFVDISSVDDFNKKMSLYKEFRKKIKTLEKNSVTDEQSANLAAARKEIILLYHRRVNQALAEMHMEAMAISRLEGLVGKEGLTQSEQETLKGLAGSSRAEENLSRFDRFIFGATEEYDQTGTRRQVGSDLHTFATVHAEEYADQEINKYEKIRAKGLDPEKVLAENIPEETYRVWLDETLTEYNNQLIPKEEQWKANISAEFISMGTNGKKREVRSGNKPKSVVEAISILLAHETEGHALQHINKERLPLNFFQVGASDRAEAYFEAGAMWNEDYVTSEAFGFRTQAHPHYIRAMAKKLEGGDYVECIQAFYASALESLQKAKKTGKINEKMFDESVKSKLKEAVNRARRLFPVAGSLADHSGILAKSKDTVYLEQILLQRKLKEAGMEKYLYMGGTTIDTVIALTKIGILDPKSIQAPKFHSLKIWERIKGEYAL